jgi:acetyltransferase-like isoleucine patch superfamily enzyme
MLNEVLDTPWKAVLEIKRILYHPFVVLYLKLNGVKLGKNTKWYGFPLINRHRSSEIIIGDRVEVRNWKDSNPLGVIHPLILTTWSKNSKIIIGNDVGISGGSICSAVSINIGKGTLVGANSTIIDTDFHPIKSKSRRYDKKNVKSIPVQIGSNSFIGMNSIILKGVKLADNFVVPAGSVVSRSSNNDVK